MSDISSNIALLRQSLPPSVRLVAVSKTKSTGEILEAYNAGQRDFGENRVQELLGKKDLLPVDIQWHLIGHLQRNKVKYIAPFISMIHSVDSLRLLSVINGEANGAGRIINVLLQIHIASEETKFGFSREEVEALLGSGEWKVLENVRICGLMGMATFTSDISRVRAEFRSLADLYSDLKKRFFPDDPGFREISMGMSGDYRIAVEEGSTMVRIGSLIFGERIMK
jgi:pyridoxal phosphate enzyme (YggS family)